MRNPLPFLIGIRDLELRIRVVPGGSRSEIVGAMADGTLKMRVAAGVENGGVNDEVCTHIARLYGVQKSAVTIHRGKNSPLKMVRIAASALAAAPPRAKAGVGFSGPSLLPVQ